MSLKSLLLYRSLCLYNGYRHSLCEVIQPSNFQVQKVGSADTFFVCLEQTLGMTGILLKYFSCCAMLTYTQPPRPLIFPVYRSWFLSQAISYSFLFFFFFLLETLLFISWFAAAYTDQVLPSDSVLILESKMRNYYNPIAIVPLLFFYTVYYTYVQLYIEDGRVLSGSFFGIEMSIFFF